MTLCGGRRLYVEAGADAIFPEALESKDEFADLRRGARAGVPLLANMTEFGRSPTLDFAELADWAIAWSSTR